MKNEKKTCSILRIPYSTLGLLDEVCEKFELNRQQTLAVLITKSLKELKQ